MIWLNLETRILHAPEYIGSDPRARATWLNVCLWSAQQENGGRIAGAAAWKDRQWQQTCGVTLREVSAAAPLLAWDGEDVIVWAYPVEKEAVVRQKRELARIGGRQSGEARRNRMDTPNTEANAEAYGEANASTERKGREEEGNGRGKEEEGVQGKRLSPSPAGNALVLTSEPAGAKAPRTPQLTDAEWLAGLKVDPAYQGIDVDREHAKAARWCIEHNKHLTRRRFVVWLNRCERPMGTQTRRGEFANAF